MAAGCEEICVPDEGEGFNRHQPLVRKCVRKYDQMGGGGEHCSLGYETMMVLRIKCRKFS